MSLFGCQTLQYYHTLNAAIQLDSKSNEIRYMFYKYRKLLYYKIFVDNIICPSYLSSYDFTKTYKWNTKNLKVIENTIEDVSKKFDLKILENDKICGYETKPINLKDVLDLKKFMS